MDSTVRWVIPLTEATEAEETIIGGKAAKLARLASAGFRVARGFCITTAAYDRFLQDGDLAKVVRMELGRKPLDSMRWEEVWDAALRIRLAFHAAPIPNPLRDELVAAVERLGRDTALAVRSSAPGEDSANRSFAGLHESLIGVTGAEEALDAIKLVWASLWSDAALLYRQELSLDPSQSQMAVLVQEVIRQDRSGVAFARDPREPHTDRAIVEAVPGPCSDLVDGVVDPDRWILERPSGEVLSWRPGERENEPVPQNPILQEHDLNVLYQSLTGVESLFGWPPDMEWTGHADDLTLLQARPITTAAPDTGDQRSWYMTLRPGMQRLNMLRKRVADERIPELEALGERLAGEPLEQYHDRKLAAAIEERLVAVQEWKKIYWDEFIPFAHGVRQLATYYNDVVQPEDPYEFVGLLRGQRMLAALRNEAIERLAQRLRESDPLKATLRLALSSQATDWQFIREQLQPAPGGETFVSEFEDLLAGQMDVSYQGQRLSDRPDLLLQTVFQMAQAANLARPQRTDQAAVEPSASELENRLLAAVGQDRHQEARDVVDTARLSWRLRDDDNVLVGRLDSQLQRALDLAASRLSAAGRLRGTVTLNEKSSPLVAQALRDPAGGPVDLPAEEKAETPGERISTGESPRQLIGQPASPGLTAGIVRTIRDAEDLGRFQAGEILVCDAIQPTMTHLVPLARAIVERRGGMLIHGAIIARELGIPCVNGIANAVETLKNGDLITVDGYLGIVTVGPPEFDLEGVPLPATVPEPSED